MLYYLLLIFTAPLILMQGRHVRKVMPVLPEPSGGRCGQSGKGEPLNLIIMGDSAAAGVGVLSQDKALSGCLVQRLSHRHCVNWSLEAKSGNSTLDMITAIESGQYQSDVENKMADTEGAVLDEDSVLNIDVILVSLGVNDLLSPLTESQWIKQQSELIKLLTSTYAAKHILLTAVPPMECFTAFPQPLRGILGLRAKAFNQKLSQLIERHDECELVAIPLKPNAADMACDGFHPGANIYQVWANHVSSVIHRRVSNRSG